MIHDHDNHDKCPGCGKIHEEQPSFLFDESAIYEGLLFPLIKQIHEICAQHKIPFFSTFAISQDEDASHITTSTFFPGPLRTPTEYLIAARLIEGKATEDSLKLMALLVNGHALAVQADVNPDGSVDIEQAIHDAGVQMRRNAGPRSH